MRQLLPVNSFLTFHFQRKCSSVLQTNQIVGHVAVRRPAIEVAHLEVEVVDLGPGEDVRILLAEIGDGLFPRTVVDHMANV